MRSARSAAVPIAASIAIGVLVACAAVVVGERARVGPGLGLGARDGDVTPKRKAPLASAGRVVADDSGPLAEILMHYVPELEPAFVATYHDFLLALPSETRIVFVIRRGDRPRLDAFLARVDGGGAGGGGGVARRVRAVEIDTPLGIWSKDRALVLEPSRGGPIELLVPPRTRTGEGSRPADWDIVPAVAAAMPDRFDVRRLPFAFDAGDFAIAGDRIVLDVNLFARNRARGYRSPTELRDRVQAAFGRDVVMLGTEIGDVPRHHVSMYMAPLDGGTVLVGDPAAGARIVGADFVPGERSAETGEPLRADFSPETAARFERAAADLARAGFRVVRIPTVPFDDKTYFAYTNGVYETRRSGRTAWMPRFDVPKLDDAARAVYESLGWRVAPVSARGLYAQHGTLGCVVNVVARERAS